MRVGRASPGAIRLVLLAVAASGAVASPATGQEAAHVAIRDSAGVEVVVNSPGGTWEAGGGWRLTERPLVDVGTVDGPRATQLHRVADAVRLADGRIAVANGGSGEIRYFDPDGRPLRSVGGAGGGPAEFTPFAGGTTGLAALGRLAGDTVAAFDLVAGSVSVFGPGGGFVRSVPLAAPDGGGARPLEPLGWTDGGGLAVAAPSWGDVEPGARLRRPTATLRFYGPDGRLDASGPSYPGEERYTAVIPRDASGAFTVTSLSMDPFLRELEGHARGNRVAVGATDRYRIDVYGPGGDLLRVVRGPGGARPLEEEVVDAWLAEKLAEVDDPASRKRYRRAADPSVLPDSLPAFESLLLDVAGRLWVREHRAPGTPRPDGTARWSVYDRRGRRLGTVEMPARLEPFEIGDDYVVGLWRDELGVEHVRVYGLEKAGPGEP